jgi:hypothetical protein
MMVMTAWSMGWVEPPLPPLNLKFQEVDDPMLPDALLPHHALPPLNLGFHEAPPADSLPPLNMGFQEVDDALPPVDLGFDDHGLQERSSITRVGM